jgi:hypothetical protein
VSDRLHVLTAIYQSERADRSTTFTVSLAAMGAAVTYLIGTIAFYDKLDFLGWSIALLPFPLLCISAFHALLLNLAALRARGILALEHVLLTTTAPPKPDLDHATVGTTATERATNIHTAALPVKTATLIAYGGIGATYPAYTVLMLVKAAAHTHAWLIVPATAYIALLTAIAFTWRHAIANLRLAVPATGKKP